MVTTSIRGARGEIPPGFGAQERRCEALGITLIQCEPAFWILSVRSLDRMKLRCYFLLLLVSFLGVESAPCEV